MNLKPAVIAVFVVISMAMPAAIAGATATEHCSFPHTTTDASGTEITINEEPTRVVTLSPSAAQTMWEIGARDKVVGMTRFASYLNGSDDRTLISGEEQAIVIERVVNLTPDLVLAPNTVQNDTVDKLREAGLTVYHFPPVTSVPGVYEATSTIGRLTGTCDGAESTVSWMQERIGVVEDAVAGQDRPDVLYLFFGFTAGNQTFIHEILTTAGGTNVAAEVGINSYQQISEEVVVEQDPDWIVLNSDDPAIPNSNAYNNTTAVQQDQVVVVQIEHINQPAPRIVHAITKLAKQFHPDAYATANTTPTPTPTVTDEPTASPTQPTVTDQPATESPGQPGFGVLMTVAILGSLIAGLRFRQHW